MLEDFNGISAQWVKEATVVEQGSAASFEVTPSASEGPREVTEEEWKRICARERAFVEGTFRPGNPFL